MAKEITITLCRINFIKEWRYDVDPEQIAALAGELDAEYASIGVNVRFDGEIDHTVEVRGYGDLLNSIRLRSSEAGVGNPCLGHVIGESKECNFLDDIKRGVSRIAFAPEMIEPDGAFKKVCHNCGCGC
ncbi:MAG: hypothetical protein C0615_01220 [Desulfuromonas sp.]|nr:MAG: hypothetical protein C0615_01220 [Desulfuromonas sp.]